MKKPMPSKSQRIWLSLFFWLLGMCAAICTIGWWPAVQHIAGSRIALGLFSVWCFVLWGFILGSRALLLTLRPFAEVDREGLWPPDDDDDFHPA